MFPFKVSAVVTCDDIRLEQNNKHILIGVYNGALVVAGFPTEIPLSWWIQLLPEKAGNFELEVQLVQDDTATLLRAMLGFAVITADWAALVLPPVRLQLQGPGKLKLQLKLKDQSDWHTIQELSVTQGQVASAIGTEIRPPA
jgi:hypothetical protein